MIRIQRHPQGPRVFVLGRRIHEYMVGLWVEVAVLAAWLTRALHPSLALLVVASTGGWLIAKDWRDLFPCKRDTACWRVGLHRRARSVRPGRRSEGLALLAALGAFAVAAVNVASALTPEVPWRVRLLLQLEPIRALPLFHAAALPAGASLAIVAVYLQRRRRRALHVALLLLVVSGLLDLVKGLDFEEAALSWGLAVLLWCGRSAFYVGHRPVGVRSALWRVPLLSVGAAVLAAAAVWAATPAHLGLFAVGRETVALLAWSHAPMTLREGFGWVPAGVGLSGVASLVACGYLFFRPLAASRRLPDPGARRVAFELVRSHGRDTLSFFKLRADIHYFFSADRRAFLGYRIENGVLLISGDPVGPPDALRHLLGELCVFAEFRGLKLGAVGAGADLLALYEEAGLRSLYIGDEAVVDTGSFSLEGRAIRKVRQSVSRLTSAGYTAELHRFGRVDETTRIELEQVSSRWRGGEPERGFSMAMDALDGDHRADSAVVVARDGDGVIRGFLHFVPTYGRPAMSLSFMRRDRDTPNGLSEYLVVSAIELFRKRGIEELSLNFAAFGRLMHSPTSRLDRLLGRIVKLGNPYFQIESLYRFNAKFSPRWVPRYLLYERRLGLARVALAALRVEGQVPKLRLGRKAQPASPACASAGG